MIVTSARADADDDAYFRRDSARRRDDATRHMPTIRGADMHAHLALRVVAINIRRCRLMPARAELFHYAGYAYLLGDMKATSRWLRRRAARCLRGHAHSRHCHDTGRLFYRRYAPSLAAAPPATQRPPPHDYCERRAPPRRIGGYRFGD